MIFKPLEIFYEENIKNYELGKELLEKYSVLNIPMHIIENHNNIEELRKSDNKEFAKLKQYLIIGTRKTHKFVPNKKISDYLVPYTSSGCVAMCLYCYLVCNFNKCSYLRLFVNREEMLDKIIKVSNKAEREEVYEIGSNSDMIVENTITNNLVWTIPQSAKNERGYITFPTKFDMVDPILDLDHKGRIIFRMSVNPKDIIEKIELGTSNLDGRIVAINKMAEAGYKIGILIAPVILLEDWKNKYLELVKYLDEKLSSKAKKEIFFEVIFMTYSYVHRMINGDMFPRVAEEIYKAEMMKGRGNGKYVYKAYLRDEGEKFIKETLKKYFPNNEIKYIS